MASSSQPRVPRAHAHGVLSDRHLLVSGQALHHRSALNGLSCPPPRNGRRSRASGCDAVDGLQVIRRQVHLDRAHIFLQTQPALRAGNGHDLLACAKSQARANCAGVQSSAGHLVIRARRSRFLLEVLSLEPRGLAPEVIRFEVVELPDSPRQEAAPSGLYGTNPLLSVRSVGESRLRDRDPEGVFGLQRRYGMLRVGASDGSGFASDRPRNRTLPAGQAPSSLRRLFDREGRIHPVLVVEVVWPPPALQDSRRRCFTYAGRPTSCGASGRLRSGRSRTSWPAPASRRPRMALPTQLLVAERPVHVRVSRR